MISIIIIEAFLKVVFVALVLNVVFTKIRMTAHALTAFLTLLCLNVLGDLLLAQNPSKNKLLMETLGLLIGYLTIVSYYYIKRQGPQN